MSSHKIHYRISSPVTQSRDCVWDMSKITVKRSGGGWLIFSDKNKKQINSDVPTWKGKMSYYRHIPYIGPSPDEFRDEDSLPRNTEVSKNYNAFIPKRELVSTYQEMPRTRAPEEEYYPRIERKGWIGREPLTAPFRMSTKIFNERRMNELETMRKSARTTAPFRSPRRTHKMNHREETPNY